MMARDFRLNEFTCSVSLVWLSSPGVHVRPLTSSTVLETFWRRGQPGEGVRQERPPMFPAGTGHRDDSSAPGRLDRVAQQTFGGRSLHMPRTVTVKAAAWAGRLLPSYIDSVDKNG